MKKISLFAVSLLAALSLYAAGNANLRTAKIVYNVTGPELKESVQLTVQGKKIGRVRFDIHSGEENYVSCLNGNSAWGSSKKDGTYLFKHEEAMELLRDISLLPFSFGTPSPFHRPTPFEKDVTINGVLCSGYQTTPADGSSGKTFFYFDRKSQDLYMVKSEDGDGVWSAVFENYRPFRGVQLATLIRISGRNGEFVLKLQSASTNIEIQDSVFLPPVDKKTIEKRIHGPRKPNKAALEKEKRDLEIRIKADEDRVRKMEQLFSQNQNTAVTLALHSGGSGRYRSIWGYGYTSYRSSRRSNKSAVRRLGKQNEEIAQEYDAIVQRITDQKIRLEDVKSQLQKFQEK